MEISRNGKMIAEVLIFGSSAAMIRFLFAGIVIAICCVGIALVATGILARQLRSGVIDPLNHAVEVARSVRVERAFSRRVPVPGLKEVDNFVEDFNSLLSELQGWYEGLTQENLQLEQRATSDALTGIGNRALFERDIQQAIEDSRREKRSFALLYLDGDNFKQINDTHGHDAGDAVLRAISERLRSCVRETDRAYRLGGDEFAVVLTSPIGQDEVSHVVERISQAMRFPVRTPFQGMVRMSLSIGCAFYPSDGETAAELCKKADEAMYRDKLRRRNNDLASSL
jgi:diguanylate cyclase (GGDEF)-like protein